MDIFFVWFLLSIAVGVLAGNKGRSGFGFFLLSLVLSPLIGLLFAVAVENLKNKIEKPNPNTHVRCPDCRELVLMDASKCKHCGTLLVPQKNPEKEVFDWSLKDLD